MDKKIIPHNTFSYLPVRQWYLKPFAWIAKCQSMNIVNQLRDKNNIYGLDLRIRFDEDGTPVFAHGLIEYDDVFPYHTLISSLKYIEKKTPFYVRVMLETTIFMSKKEREYQNLQFVNFCDWLKNQFPNIIFYGGWPRDRWRKKIYDFNTQEPSVTEMHGSVSGNKLNCLRLKSWAKKHNHEIIENAKTEYVMLDYIEFQ